MSASQCGTYSGYQTHKRHRTEPCDECREANRVYHLNYRATNAAYIAKNNHQTKALARAKTRVANAHPDELFRAYSEELAATRPQQQEEAS